MSFPKSTQLTTGMIYFGTFLVSVLSFCTTFSGMTILVSWPLALIGSLGLQTALLGIAWNLMKVRGNRLTYVTVFAVAASFSIFFSYANFNFNLKANTRGQKVRAAYAEKVHPALRSYTAAAKEARFKGAYQLERMSHLVAMERSNGWATVVDEGSQDPFVQSVIEGARRTVESWNRNQGTDYHQGAGEGIIINYLTTWQTQLENNLDRINRYIADVDSMGQALSVAMPVPQQFEVVNQAATEFPTGEFVMITSRQPAGLAEPPSTIGFIEQPLNSQEAMMLVIGDLFEMDRLTFFALMFAIAVDLIVVIMAFAGSRVVDETSHLYRRVQRDSYRRTRKVPLEDPYELSKALDRNLERLIIAGRYGLALNRNYEQFERDRRLLRLRRGPEQTEDVGADPGLVSTVNKWSLGTRMERQRRLDRVESR